MGSLRKHALPGQEFSILFHFDWFLRAGFVPLSCHELMSPVFWNGLLGFWGALGLLAGGISQWNNVHLSLNERRVYRGVAFFAGGSFLIWCSSVTLLFELSSPHIVSTYIRAAAQRHSDAKATQDGRQISPEEAC